MYLTKPNDLVSQNYYVDGKHKWGLPGVTCPSCRRVWGTVGVTYPGIDLAQIQDEMIYREPRNVPLNEFHQMQEHVQAIFRKPHYLPPGTQLGYLEGKIRGRPQDFIWLNLWTLLAMKETWEMLSSSSLSLPKTTGSHLQSLDQLSLEILEPELVLSGDIFLPKISKEKDQCSICNYKFLKLPNKIVLVKQTLTSENDIFRCSNFPTLIIATEKFKAICEELKIQNITFQKIDIV